MPIDLKKYAKLAAFQAPPGQEARLAEFCLRELQAAGLPARKDRMGNVCARVAGAGGRKVALCAHLDEIAMVISKIESDGSLRVLPQGLFWNYSVDRQPVSVCGRSALAGVVECPADLPSPERSRLREACYGGRRKVAQAGDSSRECDLSQAVVKLGFHTRAQALRAGIRPGDRLTFTPRLKVKGDLVIGKAADDRTGVFCLLDLARRFAGASLPFELHVVLNVQEEGASIFQAWAGIGCALAGIEPDDAILVDTFRAAEDPFPISPNQVRPAFAAGPAVVKGPQELSDDLADEIIAVAGKRKIPFQVLPMAATFTDAMVVGRMGLRCAAIFIPTRRIHSAQETFSRRTLAATIALLRAVIGDDITRAP